MNVKISREKIFWNIANENVPSKEYFDNFKNRMIEADVKVNFESLTRVSIVSELDDITYVWINHLDKDYFYYVSGIEKILSKGYVLNLQLDLYCTYTLNYIENLRNNEKEIQIIRSHLFDEKSIQYDDSLLDSVNIQYENVNVNKTNFNEKEYNNETIYYTDKGGISNVDVNANMYYVFKEGVNGNYTFLPVLSNNLISKVYIPDYEIEVSDTYIATCGKCEKVETFRFIDNNNEDINERGLITYHNNPLFTNKSFIDNTGHWKIQIMLNEINNIDYVIRDAYNNNKAIKWEILKPNYRGNGYNNWDYLENFLKNECNEKNWIDITNKIIYGTLPTMFVNNEKWYTMVAGSSYEHHYSSFLRSVEINKFYGYTNLWVGADALRFDNKTIISNYHTQYDVIKNYFNTLFRIKIGNKKYKTDKATITEVYNSIVELDKLKLSSELSNKFLGIFYLPHILDMMDNTRFITLNNKKFLALNLTTEGLFLAPFNICNLSIDKNWNSFNNPNIANKNLFKYLKLNYYNNDFKTQYRYINDKGTIRLGIGGLLFFTSNGVLITKPDLLSLQEGVITYPYQLPSGVDTYINYVNSTKNSSDTSYQIARQQAIVNGVFGGVNGLLGYLTGTGRALGGIATGNPMEILKGLGTAGASGLEGIQSITNSIMSVQFKENQLRAHYKDKNNSLGNQILESQTQDIMWKYYNYDFGQYNIIEQRNLTTNSIKALNNVIYLYGEYYPRLAKLNDVWNIEGLDFRYIQLDKEFLALEYEKYCNAPLDLKDAILNQLNGGLRIWDKEVEYNYYDNLPEEDKVYIDKTDEIENEIKPPQLPLPNENIEEKYEVVINYPHFMYESDNPYVKIEKDNNTWTFILSSTNKTKLFDVSNEGGKFIITCHYAPTDISSTSSGDSSFIIISPNYLQNSTDNIETYKKYEYEFHFENNPRHESMEWEELINYKQLQDNPFFTFKPNLSYSETIPFNELNKPCSLNISVYWKGELVWKSNTST